MINQSILIPMAVKTLTRASDSASIPVIPGTIMSAKTQGTGTLLKVRNNLGIIEDLVVTEAVATVINGTMLFLVTPIVRFGSVSAAKYIRVDTVAKFDEAPGGTLLTLLSDDNGQDQGASLAVTESVATIQGRIDAAIIAGGGGGGGGSFGSITATGATQGTAAAITTSVVRITGGAAATGVILTTATGAEECYVHNATTSTKVIYPATGEFIDPSAVNEGVTIGPGEAILFKCTLAAHWSSELQVSNTQIVTPTGTVQGGGQIKTGVTNVFVNPTAVLNTAITLPPATVGYAITLSIATTGANAQIFPFGTDQINLSGAGTRIFLKANSTQSLVCNEAGFWVDGSSAVKNLIVDTIAPRTAGADVAINDSAGANVAVFGTDIELFKELGLYAVSATATAGGNQATGFSIDSNFFTIATCATLGDSCTLGNATYVWIKNNGVASAYVYCALGGSMNGTLNGYVIIAPGQVYYISGFSGAAYSTLLTSPAGSYVAAAGVAAPSVVHPASVVTTVTNPGDAVRLINQCPSVVIKNDGANALTVNPPAVGTINGLTSLLCPIGSVVNITQTTATDWTATFDSPGRQSGTAFATGGQASGTPVIGTAVNVDTVATAGDSYTIQPFSPRDFQIWNRGANRLDLFPSTGGTINGGAANAAFSIPAGVGFRLTSNDGSTWLIELLPGGAQVSTANVGSDQATGEPILGSVECLVCANAGDAYSIQTWSPKFFYIRNSGANALDLFPPVGGQINGGGANVALSIAAAASYVVYSNDGVLWYAVVQ